MTRVIDYNGNVATDMGYMCTIRGSTHLEVIECQYIPDENVELGEWWEDG